MMSNVEPLTMLKESQNNGDAGPRQQKPHRNAIPELSDSSTSHGFGCACDRLPKINEAPYRLARTGLRALASRNDQVI